MRTARGECGVEKHAPDKQTAPRLAAHRARSALLDDQDMPPKSRIALRARGSAGGFKEKKAPKEEAMDDRVLADLGPDERKLLAIFARYGRDGRAITTASLMAHAGFGLDRKRLSEALGKLAGRGDHARRRRSIHRVAGGLPIGISIHAEP